MTPPVCAPCGQTIAVYEASVNLMPGLVAHRPCHDAIVREQSRPYRVAARSALGYPLRFEVNA